MYTLSRLLRELTHNAQQGGHETRRVGVGWTKQWGTETLADLWKGVGLGGEHGVYKMDITGTFRKENREFKGSGFGVDSLG